MRTLALLAVFVGGCGPLTYPMVDRLEPESQAQVDAAWENMLSPPGRLDRTLLLDTLLCMQAHHHGVDRLDLVSEKRVGQGRVVMTVRFDRERPEFDEYVVAYLDEQGREARRERYTPGEIRERMEFFQRRSCLVGEEGHAHCDPEECRQCETRMQEIQAATQPAQ